MTPSPVPPPLPSPADLNRVDVRAVLADPTRKQAFVTPMFEHVAARYDDFTRLFSFGMDAGWKRSLLSRLPREPVSRALDVACGTGDLAFAVSRAMPNASVVGIDAASHMIGRARARAEHESRSQLTFRTGDLTDTSLESGSVDLITAGYAFRNAPSLAPALREMARVLRPGGSLLVLDFYRPDNVVWRKTFLAYLRTAGSLVGWWWHRSPILYAYIADSIDAYVSIAGFERALQQAGFRVQDAESRLARGIGLHSAVRIS
jgi:demethylmenaquinone methyltransferase/2-methoxy-6-polyprenyl-1,4-benzoquinol methylase